MDETPRRARAMPVEKPAGLPAARRSRTGTPRPSAGDPPPDKNRAGNKALIIGLVVFVTLLMLSMPR